MTLMGERIKVGMLDYLAVLMREGKSESWERRYANDTA